MSHARIAIFNVTPAQRRQAYNLIRPHVAAAPPHRIAGKLSTPDYVRLNVDTWLADDAGRIIGWTDHKGLNHY